MAMACTARHGLAWTTGEEDDDRGRGRYDGRARGVRERGEGRGEAGLLGLGQGKENGQAGLGRWGEGGMERRVFSKVIANRLCLVAKKIIRPSQTAFLSWRNILEGVVVLHETLHELRKKKLNDVVLKLDFEKAYDKVNWSFLQQTLRIKGFSPLWCRWIEQILSKGSVGVKVNDDIGKYFQTWKGLRRGDLLSPFLFNLVVDMLAILLTRAKENSKFRGVIPHLLSGLKINFHKSELFLYGEAQSFPKEYSELFGCNVGSLPFRYLGIPMHRTMIANKNWFPGKLLSSSGRLVLMNSVLSSLPMFMFSFFEAPKGVLKKLDYYRSRFFWQCDEHKKKYRLTKWNILSTSRDIGGLGILNLEVRWTMARSFSEKYLHSKAITQISKQLGDFQFWVGLMHVKEQVLSFGSFRLQNGKQIRFWEDQVVRRKNVTVDTVLSTVPLNVSFRRALIGEKLIAWHDLVSKVALVVLGEGKDIFTWNLNKNGSFSVSSMYSALVQEGCASRKNLFWALKVPLKIKIFLWFLKRGVVLTEDNLSKRQWKGNLKCSFCNADETIQHLFFDCHVARFPSRLGTKILLGATALCWAIWLSRNDMVFNRFLSDSFKEIMFSGIYWIRCWTKLSTEDDKEILEAGCRKLEVFVLEFLGGFGWRARYRIDAIWTSKRDS
ncbi:hypothetical protein U9M48_021813 [Paspalum notatum var. saurae]|uniref:Reverse transcriptase domain-containing protein n=1 Tax=Paspalum notatum var. saurae TaxID=547442 RepID=A0AAQ3TGE9_PASNO